MLAGGSLSLVEADWFQKTPCPSKGVTSKENTVKCVKMMYSVLWQAKNWPKNPPTDIYRQGQFWRIFFIEFGGF